VPAQTQVKALKEDVNRLSGLGGGGADLVRKFLSDAAGWKRGGRVTGLPEPCECKTKKGAVKGSLTGR